MEELPSVSIRGYAFIHSVLLLFLDHPCRYLYLANFLEVQEKGKAARILNTLVSFLRLC